jgi:UDP-GlcNAc3NAcA epimerase
MMKILSVVGARPQFVKAAMVHSAINKHNQGQRGAEKLSHCLVHTGQHYEHTLSDVFFAELPLPTPDHHLGVGSGPHGAQTGAMLEKIEAVLLQEKPNVVVVYGDTNSTVAASLAAAKLHIPVAHVEAGLRSFNREMPEEINRVVADHLSDLLFCPTRTAVVNLKKEGIKRGMLLAGDVMLDSVREFLPYAARHAGLLEKIGVKPKEYILTTIHRAENTDAPGKLSVLLQSLLQLNRPVVFPMHPRLRDRLTQSAQLGELNKLLRQASHIHILEPVAYLDMLMLETNARLVMTDSGGVQKEAYFLGVPCLTLREETEWLETLKGGWNRLVSVSPNSILRTVEREWPLRKSARHNRPQPRAFGRGDAAERILREILKFYRQQ